MDSFWKDLAQVSAWLVAAVGGVIAALKATWEMAASRKQRAEELRWKKAQAARDLLNTCYADPWFRNAVVMLDWDGWRFEIDGKAEVVNHHEIYAALRLDDSSPTPKETFIRQSFDRLFEAFERIEHSIAIELVEYADVQYVLEFYIDDRLAKQKGHVARFLQGHGFLKALQFFDRCPGWKGTSVPGTDRSQGAASTQSASVPRAVLP